METLNDEELKAFVEATKASELIADFVWDVSSEHKRKDMQRLFYSPSNVVYMKFLISRIRNSE